MYVAKIKGAGMDALAALGIVLPVTIIIQSFANLIGLGGAPRACVAFKPMLGKYNNKHCRHYKVKTLCIKVNNLAHYSAYCGTRYPINMVKKCYKKHKPTLINIGRYIGRAVY